MTRSIVIRLTAVGLLFCAGLGDMVPAHAQSMSDYTSIPPFVTTAVPPNILLLMDNSGSMNNSAYHDQNEAYDSAKTYNGYFDPTKCYSYATQFNPGAVRAAASPRCGGTDKWDGNFLNWLTMSRIEIAKWVMIGGKCEGRDSNGDCKGVGKLIAESDDRFTTITAVADGVTAHTGTRCFDRDNDTLKVYSGSSCSGSTTNYAIKVNLTEEPSGVVQQVGNKARFGLMEFKSSGDGSEILGDVGGDPGDMIKAIDKTKANTWTPLAESLYEATRYFAQIKPAFDKSDYSYTDKDRDPYYFKAPTWASTSQYLKCCKSYVIIFTDGQPTQDLNISSDLKDWAHTVANHPPVGFTGHCSAPNYPTGCTSPHGSPPHNSHGGGLTNHETQVDHHDNCSAYFGGQNGDSCVSQGSHYLDDVAYYAHTTDLRNGTIRNIELNGSDNDTGKDIEGIQSLTIYTFFAFGTGAKILQDAAKYGGFEDTNGNNMPDVQSEWDKVNNVTGATGSDSIPDNYFESSNADDLKDRLTATINSILRRSASGTSASVLASSSTGEGALYQAYFYPSILDEPSGEDIRWTGYTQGLFVDAFGNLREDTNQDGKLVLSDDYIVKTRYVDGKVWVDRYIDNSPADGKADSATPLNSVDLREIKAVWEAGKQLALKDHATRNIYTWVDSNSNGLVDAGEQIEFKKTSPELGKLTPYLRGELSPSVFTTTNIIDFIRGCYDPSASGPCPGSKSMRNRRMTVDGNLQVWKLGDPIHSTPTIVGAPKERYDVIYGDSSYTKFYQDYRSRRQVAYVGANDGMLHAFNGGFYRRGDDKSSAEVEHGRFTKSPGPDEGPDPGASDTGIALGDELWGFIPMQLLPHLKWLAQPDYSHVYFVDLKPKITDVRIFCDSAAGGTVPAPCINGQSGVSHPNGWGTILIGGFRMGGSCEKCSTGAAPPMSVTADFGSGVVTRKFYSAYFVLDITNPDAAGGPKLLWSFTDVDLGLTTSYPAVLRVKPPCTAANCKAELTDAKWFAVFGSGLTSYDIKDNVTGIKQASKLFAIDILAGPGAANAGVTTFSVSAATNSSWKAFMGDLATVDLDLDYRADTAYVGSLIHDGGVPWRGTMYRLTTACPGTSCSTATWGITYGSGRTPTAVIETFGSTEIGPVTSAPTITKDDSNKLWLFFGTGRFYSQTDKSSTEQQYFFGVKDKVFSGGCASESACVKNLDLVDVTNAVVCSQCSGNQVTGVGSVTTLLGTDSSTTLQGLVKSKDGWFTKLTLPDSTAPRERVLASPTLLGGIVFFPSFVPVNDICTAVGNGYLYALFYLTGSAYKESVIGTDTVGGNTMVVKRSISLGEGQVAQLGVHIGAQGTGAGGTNSGGGCQGGTAVIGQSSTGAISGACVKTQSAWSRYLSWSDQRL